MNKKFRVFVYGTLRQHERNHYLLKEAKCLSRQCWTLGVLYDTGCGYPAMVKNGEARVYGELYEVNEEQLEKLDWLEGFSGDAEVNHYDRITQFIYTDTETIEAYVYVYLNDEAEELQEIKFGDWKCHCLLDSDELLYFAYGSCMDIERFELAGVAHHFEKVTGCGIADNYALAYTRKSHDGGRADMIEKEGSSVEGKVYHIDKSALEYLSRREGVNAGIYRPSFIHIEINGVEYPNVLTYLVIDKEDEVAPPEHYATEILRGSKGFVSALYYQKLEDELFEKFGMRLG